MAVGMGDAGAVDASPCSPTEYHPRRGREAAGARLPPRDQTCAETWAGRESAEWPGWRGGMGRQVRRERVVGKSPAPRTECRPSPAAAPRHHLRPTAQAALHRAQSSKFRDKAGQKKRFTSRTRFAPRPPPACTFSFPFETANRMRRAELLPLLLPLLLLDSAFAWAVCTCSPHPSSRSTLSSSSRHRLGVLRLEAPSSPPSPPPEADADEERSKERAGGYYQGMVSSPLDFRADEQLDNLTPNIKLVAGALGVCAALVAGFLAANGVL